MTIGKRVTQSLTIMKPGHPLFLSFQVTLLQRNDMSDSNSGHPLLQTECADHTAAAKDAFHFDKFDREWTLEYSN